MRKTAKIIILAGVLSVATACGTQNGDGTNTPAPTPTETVVEDTTDPTDTTTEATETTTEPTTEPTETEGSGSETDPSDEPTSEPATDEVLTFDGLGEFRLGDTDMVERGAMELEPECGIYISTNEFVDRGIYFALNHSDDPSETDPLESISLLTPEDGEPIATDEGIQPGMSFADVKEKYPDAAEETKEGDGGPFVALIAKDGDRELVFLREDYNETPIEDSETVDSIVLREHSEEMRGSC